MTTTQALLSVIIIAAVTFLTRATPFFLFRGNSVPKFIEYLGGVIPYAVMGMLIVYCLKSVSVTAYPFGLPEGIATVFVVAIHKWKHNLLLSIGSATVLYMLLVQKVFV